MPAEGNGSGIELSRRFWTEVVAPAVEPWGDGVGAALLGSGSEVLGYDDGRSRDHNFGPRLQVFVPPALALRTEDLAAELDATLPDAFDELPVRFPLTTDPGPRHRVTVTTVDAFVRETAGLDLTHPLTADDWLAAPTQLLRSLTAGEVFADPTGELAAARTTLTWYPDDVWRYVLACQWQRLGQEEAFIGRTGEVGDDLGSRIVAARLGRDLMRLAFLVERVWAPYTKWFGTAFAELELAPAMSPDLHGLVAADDWPAREGHYAAAASTVARAFNDLQLVPALDPEPRPYFDRPFRVLGAGRFADACLASSGRLRSRGFAGSVDQWVDNVDVLTNVRTTPRPGGPPNR